jgi:hypothetical protein
MNEGFIIAGCLCFGIWWLFSTMYNAITADPFGARRSADEARQLREELEKINRCSNNSGSADCMKK